LAQNFSWLNILDEDFSCDGNNENSVHKQVVKSSDTPFQENSGFKSTEANKRKIKKNCYDKAKIALGERGFTSNICNPFSEKKSSRLVMNPSLQHTTTSHNVNQLAELGFTNR